jgi:cephalosporin-C deacetylase-like acetyl esterase/pimeloyl-ACP methyl ester carboxylesterase
MRLSLLVLLALAPAAVAADDLTVLKPGPGDVPPRKLLNAFLLAECQKQFDARKAEVEKLKTPADVAKRQQDLKAKFVAALGGFPEKTPLNPRTVGHAKRDGYRIEKVIYESRPDHHVTATLYVPDGAGPFPGVLMPIGHSQNGKAADYVQRGSILLAKNGFVVLAYDPIGQGERVQLLDKLGNPAIRGSTSEHTMTGIGALLVGRGTATYRIWDGIRSLDYLTSRPEVDPKRVGCTGCSGGGTLTSYLMALDDRIAAAAPSCYLTSLERLFATIGPQDAEQNITGQVAFGMDHADYVLMRAPKPTLICAATRDFFDIQGTWATFREAKRVYGLYGFPERVDLMESDTDHGYPKSHREAMTRFFKRWLQGRDEPVTEPDFPIEKDADLLCTRTGQVIEDLKGRSVFDLNAEAAAELAKARATRVWTPGELRTEVSRLIGLSADIPAADLKPGDLIERPGYGLMKFAITTRPGVRVPGLMAMADDPARRGPLVVYVHDQGKAADAAPGGRIEQLVLKDGKRVLALDLRGFGETAPAVAAPGKVPAFGVEFKESFLGFHLNRPLLGQRVYDLLAVLNRTAELGWGRAEVIGVGAAGPVVLHAAALDDRIQAVTIEGSIPSWDLVVRTPISQNQLASVVPGALTVYDLPDLAAAISPRPLTIRNPVDPAGRPLPLAAVEEALKPVKGAYERARAADKLTITAGER